MLNCFKILFVRLTPLKILIDCGETQNMSRDFFSRGPGPLASLSLSITSSESESGYLYSLSESLSESLPDSLSDSFFDSFSESFFDSLSESFFVLLNYRIIFVVSLDRYIVFKFKTTKQKQRKLSRQKGCHQINIIEILTYIAILSC